MMTRRETVKKGLALAGCALCAAMAGRAWAQNPAAAPNEVEGPGYRLRHVGGMRETIMGGKHQAVLDLRALPAHDELQGLGPLEGLKGEVTIVDGRPSLVRITAEGGLQVSESFAAGVPFFVWAEVAGWRGQRLPDDVRSYGDLERFMDRTAEEAGLRQAFPFRITGAFPMIGFHIVDAPAGHAPGMEHHANIQQHFAQTTQRATLIGFWSRDHKGVFTPMASNMHVHFQTADNTSSGHVEALTLGAALEVMLPHA